MATEKNRLNSVRKKLEDFKQNIDLRRNSASAVEKEIARIEERIDNIYSDPIFTTEESLPEEKKIGEDISSLEAMLTRSRRPEENILNSISEMRSIHRKTKELYLQTLEKSFQAGVKEIEDGILLFGAKKNIGDSDRISKKKELACIAESYMTFKANVIDPDPEFKIKTNSDIQRYFSILKENERFSADLTELIEDYKKVSTMNEFNDILLRLWNLKDKHSIEIKKLSKWRSKVFCEEENDLFKKMDSETSWFQNRDYLSVKKKISKDIGSFESIKSKFRCPDKKAMDRCLSVLADTTEDCYDRYENIIFLEDSVREYRMLRKDIVAVARQYVQLFLEQPSEIGNAASLKEEIPMLEKYIEEAKKRIEQNKKFYILGVKQAVDDVEVKLDSSIESASKRIEYIEKTKITLTKIQGEILRFTNAVANRDKSIEIEKPMFEYTSKALDNPYLKEAVSEYVRAVNAYISKKSVWIKEDEDQRIEELIKKSQTQLEIEKLQQELELRKLEVQSMQREKAVEQTGGNSTYTFDLITWLGDHVVSPGDDRLHEAKQIISGNSRVFGGRIMRLGERLLSDEFQKLIDSYIQNPKHNYRSDQEFRKGLALGIVEAIKSPGEIADGIAAGTYEVDKLYELARKLTL